MASVTDRIAVVSGGGTGIGRAITAALVDDGYRVLILGRRERVLAAARDDIDPSRVVPVPTDLTDPDQVARAAARVTEYGRVDVLVHNAGANVTAPTDGDLAALARSWHRDLGTNLISAVLLTAALRDCLVRPGGRLIAISSSAAQRGGAGAHSAGSYAAAKAGLHGWAFGLARELGPDGITVNVVAPGYVAGTEIFGGTMSPEFHAAKVAATLVGRAGTPEDVAAAVRFIASAAAGYLTGQVIAVNGGSVMGR
jgi:3-oxoacyl-[acyl-carrier protein] reductase